LILVDALQDGEASDEMLEMSSELAEQKHTSFAMMQAYGGMLNMGTLFAAVAYGFTLASRL
jgi:hypothetical protein